MLTSARLGIALALLLATSPIGSALADDYTCDENGPCIVQASDLGGHRVWLKWSGQSTPYDFYKISVSLHGGGPQKDYGMRGRDGGQGRFNLRDAGDYEITVAGCFGSRKQMADASCTPSSEHVRMNLR
jgi:hypothetical protein